MNSRHPPPQLQEKHRGRREVQVRRRDRLSLDKTEWDLPHHLPSSDGDRCSVKFRSAHHLRVVCLDFQRALASCHADASPPRDEGSPCLLCGMRCGHMRFVFFSLPFLRGLAGLEPAL